MNTEDTVLLVRAAQQGDREAMTILYECTNPQIWRTVRTMVRDEELAKDVLQETYLRAFTRLESLREPEKLLPWLRDIATNQAKNMLEKKLPLCYSELEDEELPEKQIQAPEAVPELALEEKEKAELVNRALSVLPDGQRLILSMYYYEQLSTKEIAEALGISASTVKSQLHRGRKTLEQRLAQLRKDGVRLYGLGFFPLFLKAWRAKPTGDALRPILQAAPKPALELACTGAKAVAVSRIAAAVATVCLLGGMAYGADLLVKNRQHQLGDMRPMEDRAVQLEAELPSREAETVSLPEAPDVPEPTEAPTEPTEDPTEATEDTTAPTQASEDQAAPVPEAFGQADGEAPMAISPGLQGTATSQDLEPPEDTAAPEEPTPTETDPPPTEAVPTPTEAPPSPMAGDTATPSDLPGLPTDGPTLPSPGNLTLSVGESWSTDFRSQLPVSFSCIRTVEENGFVASPLAPEGCCSYTQDGENGHFTFFANAPGIYTVCYFVGNGNGRIWFTVTVRES